MTDWKRKLAAYLHDPPEKAYDFSPRHQQRAATHAASFGVAELWESLTSSPDWSAAAADRFVFPHGSHAGSLGEETVPGFVHPLSGRAENNQPALPCGTLSYPGQADAEQWLSDIRPEWKSEDPQTLFLRAWRKWSDHAAEHETGKGKGAELLPYLPADTRVPDGSIWHHCAVVSALEATRSAPEKGATLQPAFFIFQIGPVQDFIAQARSTRDLWSGSYLLSWLTMHAIKAVADQCGPDAVIFPGLKGQPIYDFLEQRRLDFEARFKQPKEQDAVLVPGIPNRFLAVVPAGFHTAGVEQTFHAEWLLIANECQTWLRSRGIPFDPHHERLWREQIERHWQITWQLWPWQSVKDTLAAFKALPLGVDNPIHLAKMIAESIPEKHKDERCYRDEQGRPSTRGHLDRGWAWSAHFQLCQHALDARRSLRDFKGLPTDSQRKSGHRDCLSGREEAVVQSAALEHLEDEELRHLFRHAEPLGAANLIKRVWHKAYLARLNKVPSKQHLPALQRARKSFDSVPSVAAGAWLAALEGRLADDEDLWFTLTALSETLDDAKPHLRGVAIGERIGKNDKATESRWLEHTEAEVFTDRYWRQLPPETAAQPEVKTAADTVRAFKRQFKLGEPPAYYAVLALDGDQIGKWLSGDKSPAVGEVISRKAVEYFRKHLPGEQIERWLASPRPISPSWHLQFSESLANFGLYAARRIVEDVHHGQLIYSGGDDVLAILPADEAIACARDLHAAFQGRRADMSEKCQKRFHRDAPEGFLWLAEPKKGEPTWPLLVPGPRMTVSVGLAIGHAKEPLQDMIAEAQRAEKRAKAAPEKLVFDRSDPDPDKHSERWRTNEGWDRDALAVTLFKRSGETIRWGAKFSSPALPLLKFVQTHFRPSWDQPDKETAISGRFPYRLAELLNPYGPSTKASHVRAVTKREAAFVISRQTLKNDAAAEHSPGFTREDFEKLCGSYLDDLASFRWTRPNDKQPTLAPRPLSEFINLFLLEAFIRRQAD